MLYANYVSIKKRIAALSKIKNIGDKYIVANIIICFTESVIYIYVFLSYSMQQLTGWKSILV